MTATAQAAASAHEGGNQGGDQGGDQAAAEPAIQCDRLVRVHKAGSLEVQALQGLDLRVERGEMVAMVGASGSGKSTLLNILAGLDAPSAGSARVAGHQLAGMREADRLRYRRHEVGVIWQNPAGNLLPHLTAAENVALPLRYAGTGYRARRARALDLLDELGLADHRDRIPARLSGGEQQRVAIAVALANKPSVLLADEPTGELDSQTAENVFEALRAANREHGATVLVVTHDPAIAGRVARTIAIRDGRVATETLRTAGPDSAGAGLGPGIEYAVVDSAGRLQLPREFTEPLGIRDRVRLEREADHIGVWPHQSDEEQSS
ncbi:MAG: ABC transporter ATP-binding protein [Catenulispora sp.]|nr:ABC transporter ATP-binding protein [Catenulispora sp.]